MCLVFTRYFNKIEWGEYFVSQTERDDKRTEGLYRPEIESAIAPSANSSLAVAFALIPGRSPNGELRTQSRRSCRPMASVAVAPKGPFTSTAAIGEVGRSADIRSRCWSPQNRLRSP